MTNTILIDIDLPDETMTRLQALPDVRVIESTREAEPQPGQPLRQFPPEQLREARALLCKLPPKNVDALTQLELLQLATVGFEHLVHLRLWERSFRVCNARGIFDTAIAEWNLAMMINLARDVAGMIRNQSVSRWSREARHQQEIRGKVVGLWGYGGIGRETARLAKALGMTVHLMTRSGVRPRTNTFTLPGTGDLDGTCPDRVFGMSEKDAFLTGLDFLILCLPRTRDSDSMVGETELKTLPAHAYLLNPSRGPIVNEAALLRALREGWIAGAALDTHYAYPLPTEHPLWSMPNVILTPHVSGADRSTAFPERIGTLFVENVERYLSRRPLLNELTAEEWAEADYERTS